MKRILTIFALLFSCFYTVAQTTAETALFSRINAYRDTIGGSNNVKWDTLAYKASRHHAKYLSLVNTLTSNSYYTIGHTEGANIDDFNELYDLNNRLKFFIPLAKDAGENVVGGIVSLTDSMLVNMFFKTWITSKKGHKEIIENKTYKFGACAISYSYVERKIKTSSGEKTIKTKIAYAVLVLYY